MPVQKILMVDDDKSFLYLNRALLNFSKIKCQIDECLNGEEAMAYIKNTEQQPDIILLDINMPVMDGFDFLEEYGTQTAPVREQKIYILSSSDSEKDRSKALQYSYVHGYFEKPLTDANILEILS